MGKWPTIFAAALAIDTVCIFAFWRLEDPVIYTRYNTTVQSPMTYGEPLEIDVDYCTPFEIIQGSEVRTIDSRIVSFLLPGQTFVPGAGCHSFHREIPLPASLYPGNYTYNFEADFRINPLKNKRDRARPVPFIILPAHS